MPERTHVLKVYRIGEAAKPAYQIRYTGTDNDASNQLSWMWNASPAPTEPGRWRATVKRLSDNTRICTID